MLLELSIQDLTNMWQQQGFKKGFVDNNLYIKVKNENMIIIVVYVDDIIFGSDMDNLSQRFA